MTELQQELQRLASEMAILMEIHRGEGWLGTVKTGPTEWSVTIADNPTTTVELIEALFEEIGL
tara:strand:- start:1770 stop:1958 length:189 start_codon:yes stop_codon:yes gene_type:complete